jgi:DNA-binding transcriptional MocR family regulator
MSTDPARRTIVLGPAAHELRRHVGPTAWVVLEEMLQRSTPSGAHVVAEVSIRSLGSSLGLAKDTVARAVRRLRELGAIESHQVRTSAGVFDAGSYRVTVPAVCLSPAGSSEPSALSPAPRASCAAPPSAPRASSAARPSPSARRSSGQLSLLSEV